MLETLRSNNLRNILELGSGIGLLGLNFLKYDGLINSYTFTDHNHLVLKQIEKNCSYNNKSSSMMGNRVFVCEFDWNFPEESQFFDKTNPNKVNSQLDVILASGISL